MKNCPHCNINVGGTYERCPLCQSTLQGDATIDMFPRSDKRTAGSVPVKIITFILVLGSVICMSLDFLLIEKEHIHFGLIVLTWSVAVLWYIHKVIRNRRVLSQLVAMAVILFSISAVITEIIVGFRGITTGYIVPYMISAALITNFILSLIDRNDRYSATFYVIWSIFIGIIPSLVMLIVKKSAPLAWEICFFISAAALVGLLVFKGRAVISELQKRLHF